MYTKVCNTTRKIGYNFVYDNCLLYISNSLVDSKNSIIFISYHYSTMILWAHILKLIRYYCPLYRINTYYHMVSLHFTRCIMQSVDFSRTPTICCHQTACLFLCWHSFPLFILKSKNSHTHAYSNTSDYVPVSKDVRYAKYFKMVAMGIPPAALHAKMQLAGLDPIYLDNPDQPAPPPNEVSHSTDTDSDSSD